MELGVGTAALIVAAGILFMSAIVKATTGFGYALISTPFLLILWEPEFIVPVFMPLAVIGDILIVIGTWRLIVWRQVIPLSIAGVISAPFGAYLLIAVPQDGLRLMVAFLALISAVLLFLGIKVMIRREVFASLVAGSLSGLFSTSTTMSGPPVAILLINQRFEKQRFRASLAMYFLIMQLVGAVSLVFLGPLNSGTMSVSIILLPTVILGNFVASKLVDRLPQEVFTRIAIIVVGLTASLILAQSLISFV